MMENPVGGGVRKEKRVCATRLTEMIRRCWLIGKEEVALFLPILAPDTLSFWMLASHARPDRISGYSVIPVPDHHHDAPFLQLGHAFEQATGLSKRRPPVAG
jgi:hypothetical protein